MTIGGILNVAIILCALYASLSCVCSWLNEQLAAVLNLRGAKLYRGVVNLLAGDAKLVQNVFTHPLVESSVGKLYDVKAPPPPKPKTDSPKDPNPPDPSPATPDPATPDSATPSPPTPDSATPSPPTPDSATPSPPTPGPADWLVRRVWPKYRCAYIDDRNFSAALWQSVAGDPDPLAAAVKSVATAPDDLIKALSAQVADLENEQTKKALTALLFEAGGDYDRLLKVTDAWFNAQMDRVSGWYRRQAQWFLVVIAAIIVLVGGVDSLDIAGRAAAMDPTSLNSIVASISSTVTSTNPPVRPSSAPVTAGAAPAGAGASHTPSPEQVAAIISTVLGCPATSPTPSPTPSAKASPASPAPSASASPSASPTASASPSTTSSALKACASPIVRRPFWIDPTAQHWLGLIITIIALSLGGPFWFDLLDAIINVRSAGPKPPTKADTSSPGATKST